MASAAPRFPRLAVLACVAAFAATLLARLPASWVLPVDGASCEQASGSLWRGGCHGLHVAGVTIESATWQVHPLALLRGRLSADVQADDPRVAGSASLEWGRGGSLQLDRVTARVAIDAGLAPAFPRGWSGLLELSLDHAALAASGPTDLRGLVRARGLQRVAPPLALGDYVLRFPGGTDATGHLAGELADEGGPLAVQGTVRIDAQGQYDLEGRIAARADAPPELAKGLEILGPADAEGRRPVSLAGTF